MRLVYNTGGGSGHEGPAWRSLGAQAYLGHPGNHLGNSAPMFYVGFLPAWAGGATLDEAVEAGNAHTRTLLDHPVTGVVLDTFGYGQAAKQAASMVEATVTHPEGDNVGGMKLRLAAP